MRLRQLTYALLLLVGCLSLSAAQNPSPVYQVAFVSENDVLNVRTSAGASQTVAWVLPYDANNITITGEGQVVDGSVWVPIQHGTQTGWVNRYFLTETVPSKTFCRSVDVFSVLTSLKTALEQRNGAGLQALVSPERGLLVRLNRWNKEVKLTADEVGQLFTDTTIRDWGGGQGSGLPIEGTFTEILLPLFDQDLLPDDLLSCNQVIGSTGSTLTLPDGYDGVNFYSVYHTAPQGYELEWKTWVVGIEYWDGKPYVSFLVGYQWEI